MEVLFTFICPLHFPKKSMILNQPLTLGNPAKSTVRSTAAKPSTTSVCMLGDRTVLVAFLQTLKIKRL